MGIIIVLYFCLGFQVTSIRPLSVQTYKDFIRLSWNQIFHPPEQWTVTYNVIGTNFHSVLKVPGNQNNAKIDTSNYPGVFYKIKLFASNNGSETSKGIGFGISDCSDNINVTLGSSYSFKTFGYPGGLTFGAICTWNFVGSNSTWFRVHVEDFDIGNNSCKSYFNVGDSRICGNDSVNGTLVIKKGHLSLKLNYRALTSTRGIKFKVSAIHRMEKPKCVTARIAGNIIRVEWQPPFYQHLDLTYILRVSHFPFTSHLDLNIDGHKTWYNFEVTSHRGQNFSVQLQAVSDDLASRFTDPVFTLTNCNKVVFLKATETFTLQTEQYPHHYLPGLKCHFRFQTENDFLLLILTNDLDIGGGKMCDKTYLLVESVGKFCADSVPQTRLIVDNSAMSMSLVTSKEVSGRGLNISITSVAKPPDIPTDVISSVNDDSIHLEWKPPSERQAYLKGYKVQYFIAPSTPGATLSVDKYVDNVTIGTQDHPGRLFAIRIAGYSDAGLGNFSQPFYVRSGCGRHFHLLRHETIQITSPTHEGRYEAGVVCHWTVMTDSPLWIKITIDKFMLEYSSRCMKDFVNISGTGRHCGSRDKLENDVVKERKLELIFRTDYVNESEGFSFQIEAVGHAPGPPESVKCTRAGFSIVVKWAPPRLHRRFVTGYYINFKFYDEIVNNHIRVGPDTVHHVLDMTSYPGRLLEIWLQAAGDTESSTATNRTLVRNDCGQRVSVSSLIYISSPYYRNNIYNNLHCTWELEAIKSLKLEVTFIRINLNNKENGCNNFVRVHNTSYCDDSIEGHIVLLDATSPVTLEFHTGPSGVGAHFLLKIKPFTNISDTVPSCSEVFVSSTPLLMTSYFGTLLASSLLMTYNEGNTHELTSGTSTNLEKSITPAISSSIYTAFTQTLLYTGFSDRSNIDSRSGIWLASYRTNVEPSFSVSQTVVSVLMTTYDAVISEQSLNYGQQLYPTKSSIYVSSITDSDMYQSFTYKNPVTANSTTFSGRELVFYLQLSTRQSHAISPPRSSRSVLFLDLSAVDIIRSPISLAHNASTLPKHSKIQITKPISLTATGLSLVTRTNITTLLLASESIRLKPSALEIKPSALEIKSNLLKMKPPLLEIKSTALEIKPPILFIKPTAAYLQKENSTDKRDVNSEEINNSYMLQTLHSFPATKAISINDVNKVRPSTDAEIDHHLLHNKDKDAKGQDRATSKGYSFTNYRFQFVVIFAVLFS